MKKNNSIKNMKLLSDDLYQLHRLIKYKSTGTPQQLAKKLNCAERSVYRKIKTLREDYHLPIEYCNFRQCYYYDGEVSFDFVLRINGEEMSKIIGGGDTIKNFDIFSLLTKNGSNVSEFCSCIWPIHNRMTHL